MADEVDNTEEQALQEKIAAQVEAVEARREEPAPPPVVEEAVEVDEVGVEEEALPPTLEEKIAVQVAEVEARREEPPEEEPEVVTTIETEVGERLPSDIVHTPSGDITWAEMMELRETYPEGVIAEAVEEVISIREERQVLESMQAENVPLRTQIDYLEKHPELAVANIASTNLVREQIEEYSALTGEAQFDRAIELGIIPEGSEYAGEIDGRWQYLPPEVALEPEQIPEAIRVQMLAMEAGGNTLLPDGQWIDNQQLEEFRVNYPEIYEALTTQGAVAANAIIQRQRDALTELKDYAVVTEHPWEGQRMPDVGYDITKYLKDNPFNERVLRDAGFTDAQIAVAKETVMPEEVAEPKSLVSSIWQAITPWQEDKETFGEFVKGTPKRLISPDIPPQSELKAMYDAEAASPLWAKLLFGSTVVYDASLDKYLPIYIAEAPQKGKAGAGIGGAKALTKVIEVNWNKLISPKVNKPQINWSNITKAIRAGQIKNAADAARWTKWQPKQLKPTSKALAEIIRQQKLPYKTPTKANIARAAVDWRNIQIKEAVRAAARASQLAYLGSARIIIAPSPATLSQWRPFRPSELTPSRMKELMTEWQAMKPSDAIRQINNANAVTMAVSFDPQAVLSILSKVTPAQATRTITRLQPTTLRALQAGELAKAQTLAKEQVKAASEQAITTAQELDTAVQTATEVMTKALAQGATLAEAQTATEQALQQLQITEAIAQTATQVVADTATKELAQVRPVTSVMPTTITPTPAPAPTPTPTVIRPPTPTQIQPPPLLLPPLLGGVEIGRRVAVPSGSITWQQGWDRKYIPPPYDQPKPISLGRVMPRGATKTGNRPSETLEIIGSAEGVPALIQIDLGWADIEIRNGRTIAFESGGEYTDVGRSVPSPTRGMSVGEGGERMLYNNGAEEQERVVLRPVVALAPALAGVSEEEGDNISDVTEVSEEDVIGDEGEDLSDLTEPAPEDDLSDMVMREGEGLYSDVPQRPKPAKRYRITPRGRRTNRREPPAGGLGGVRY